MTSTPDLGLAFAAQLVLEPRLDGEPDPASWFITHPLGGPAAGTYTEVLIDDTTQPDAVLETVLREVARQLYGDQWAGIYPPEQYAARVAAYGTRRREAVVVSDIEVWS